MPYPANQFEIAFVINGRDGQPRTSSDYEQAFLMDFERDRTISALPSGQRSCKETGSGLSAVCRLESLRVSVSMPAHSKANHIDLFRFL